MAVYRGQLEGAKVMLGSATPSLESWQACENRGGVLSMGPVASTWGVNRLDAFVRGTDAHIWHHFYSNGTWTWEDLGGPFPATLPAAVSFAVGRIDLFARGGDTALWQNTFTSTSGGSWSGWMSRGGKLASEPAVTSKAANSLDD